MKICHITRYFPPGWGGTETHNLTLVKYLLNRGYDIEVIVLRPSQMLTKNLAQPSIEDIKIHNIFPKTPVRWIFQLRKKIEEIEKDGKVDAFDIHTGLFAEPFFLQDKKILLSLHFFELTCPRPSWPRPCNFLSFERCRECCGIRRYIHWSFYRWYAIKKVSKIMVKYDYLRDLMVRKGVPKTKIRVIPHWIDVDAIRRKSKRDLRYLITGLEKSDRVFTYFARLSPENGPFLVLNAFNLVAQKSNAVKLVYIGGGELRAELERFCAEHNLQDKVIFLGMIPFMKVHEYLSISDVIVSSHRYMNYNWALLEAMCTKKPIIATNVAATTDILSDGYNALLAEPTPESLSSRMIDVLDNPELGKNMAENALRTIKTKHSLKNLEKYEEMIHIL